MAVAVFGHHLAGDNDVKVFLANTAPVVSGARSGSYKEESFIGRHEARLGKASGLTQFGVNLVILERGSMTTLRHWHVAEDEFVYVIYGSPTLINNDGEHPMQAGAFVGFPAGEPNGHHIVNRSDRAATILVVGSRRPGEEIITYPDDPIGPISK